jgi:outer membrane protein assembly factor BamB
MKAFLVASLAALAVAPAASAWVTAGGTAAHTFATSEGSSPPYRTLWEKRPQFGGGGLLEHGVTIAGGRVYGINISGTAFAIDVSSGKILWKNDLPGSFATAPAYSHGRLFVNDHGVPGRKTTRLRALSAATGRVLWSRRLWSEHSEGSPNVVGRRVFVPTINRRAGSFNTSTGKVIAYTLGGRKVWQRRTCGTWQAPVWTGRLFVSGSLCGRVQAFTFGGRLRWSRRIDSPVYAQIGYSAGRVVIPGRTGRVYVLSARSGRSLWSRRVGWLTGYPDCAVTRLRVWCGNMDGTVRAFVARNGRQLWVRDYGVTMMGATTLAHGVLWVVVHELGVGGRILGVRPGSGRVFVQYRGGKYDPVATYGRTVILIHGFYLQAVRGS